MCLNNHLFKNLCTRNTNLNKACISKYWIKKQSVDASQLLIVKFKTQRTVHMYTPTLSTYKSNIQNIHKVEESFQICNQIHNALLLRQYHKHMYNDFNFQILLYKSLYVCFQYGVSETLEDSECTFFIKKKKGSILTIKLYICIIIELCR